MHIKKYFSILIFLLTPVCIFAQDDEKKEEVKEEQTVAQKIFNRISLSGSVDVYFRQNIGGPNGENAIAPNTSFANLNGFALGMANLVVEYEDEKLGFLTDLVVGPRGSEAVFGSLRWDIDHDGSTDVGNSSQIINQMYVYWKFSDKAKLTFGNFNTFLGYEVISPVGNFNYSTSYMFSYGPFSHSGLRFDYQLNTDWSFMLAFMNGNDFTDFNPTNGYTLGAQVGYKGTYLNFELGPHVQIDLTSGFDITEKFYLGLNSTYFSHEDFAFYGVALYPQYSFSDSFALGLRGEYFAETNEGVGAIGEYDADGNAHVYEFTLTGSYQIKGLILKPEFRIDTASEATFKDADLNPDRSLSSFLFAAIYAF